MTDPIEVHSLRLAELGSIFKDPFGGPVDVPLDTTTPVAYMAYANPTLAEPIRPALRDAITAAPATASG